MIAYLLAASVAAPAAGAHCDAKPFTLTKPAPAKAAAAPPPKAKTAAAKPKPKITIGCDKPAAKKSR